MAIHYFSAYEYVTNKTFEMWVPAYYQSHMPEHMYRTKPQPLERVNRWRPVATRRRDPSPFYQIADPNQLQKASYTIEIMVDMFAKKVEFQLHNEDDIVEILEGIDNYLMSIKHDVEVGTESVVSFARTMIEWREEVYKHYYRYMQLNPAALEKLYPHQDIKKNLFSLMSAVTTNEDLARELDPLKSKYQPPYRVDALIPKNPEAHEAGYVENYLSNASADFVSENARDFDLEEFIRKG